MKKEIVKQAEKLLLKNKSELLGNIDQIFTEVKNMKNNNVLDEGEQARNSNYRFRNSVILNQQAKELKDIDYALLKINKKTFGICEMCSEKIDEGRILAKPQAKLCITCKSAIEQNI